MDRSVRVVEDGAGDVVLLVHGVGGWAENWREQLPAIAGAGMRAVAVDLPGHGESERVAGARYFDGADPFYARWIVAVLDALGADRAHLAGQSLGGSVVYMAAVHAPARVRTLTLVAPGGLGLELPRFLRLAALPGMTLFARLPRPRKAARDVLASCFYDPSRITPQLAAEAERYGHDAFPEMVRVLRAGVGWRGIRPSLREAWVARAGAYQGPALVVGGRQDRILPLAHAAAMREIFPRTRLVEIDRAGHLVMAERPTEFNEVFIAFLTAPAATAYREGTT